MKHDQHRWNKPDRQDLHRTKRTCAKCGIVRVTRHEPGNFPNEHWSEWERDGKPVRGKPTPKCVAV